jgi:hypothetical protein
LQQYVPVPFVPAGQVPPTIGEHVCAPGRQHFVPVYVPPAPLQYEKIPSTHVCSPLTQH